MERKWNGADFKLGVLGGGQLGRMLIQDAVNYDLRVHCMDKSESAPCGYLAFDFTEGDITDYDDVLAFGKDKDVLTVEIENVNVDALEELENQGVKVFPQSRVLKLIRDKGLQKEFYKEKGIPTASFQLIENIDEINLNDLKFPFVQKLRQGGYDGKGVKIIRNEKDLKNAFQEPSVIEDSIDFEKELSVIVARNVSGEMTVYPLVECEFSPTLNLVEFLFSPAAVSEAVEEAAENLAKKVVESLGMVGLLAVELFLTKDGRLLVNEVAPRPHNSGHHTIECNYTSQFEQHFRAILDLPLGSVKMRSPGVMVNLLGHPDYQGPVDYVGLEEVMSWPGVFVHLYGKPETKPNRKMGHATITASSIGEAKELARKVQQKLLICSAH